MFHVHISYVRISFSWCLPPPCQHAHLSLYTLMAVHFSNHTCHGSAKERAAAVRRSPQAHTATYFEPATQARVTQGHFIPHQNNGWCQITHVMASDNACNSSEKKSKHTQQQPILNLPRFSSDSRPLHIATEQRLIKGDIFDHPGNHSGCSAFQ